MFKDLKAKEKREEELKRKVNDLQRENDQLRQGIYVDDSDNLDIYNINNYGFFRGGWAM